MTLRLVSVLAGALLAGACGSDASEPSQLLCSERTGGALITLGIRSERLTVWSTSDAFIAEAQQILDAAAPQRVPVFGRLRDGRDCDAQWSWHVEPAAMEWADATVELCDGLPSLIESNKAYWLDTVGRYCPWSADVADVVEQ